MYGRRGYLQWTAATRRSPDPETKTVDLVLALDEDKRYSVGRIQFSGNQTTRDHVVRREVLLNEGDAFDTEALRQSIRRIEPARLLRADPGSARAGAPARGGTTRWT